MDTPSNPITQATRERTACINTIIYIINQLFLASNDVVVLEWIENMYCQTNRCKWDGVLLKTNDKKVSTALVEFSGGTKINATISKETSDISKLYSKMMSIITNLPHNIPKRTFCARFYGD